MPLDNNTVAILTKVNELAQHYGIKPYEFVAVLNDHSADARVLLTFDVASLKSPPALARFHNMMVQLGLGGCEYELNGCSEQIIKALDNALNLAPKNNLFR